MGHNISVLSGDNVISVKFMIYKVYFLQNEINNDIILKF